jgi:Leucine-rich repeat (LRR) protein
LINIKEELMMKASYRTNVLLLVLLSSNYILSSDRLLDDEKRALARANIESLMQISSQERQKWTELNLSYCGFCSFSIDLLRQMPQLKELNLSHNNIQGDISLLPDMQTLEKLVVSHNQLSSLDNMPDLPILKTFDASHNPIDSIGGILRPFGSLEICDLSDTKLKRFQVLGWFPQRTKVILDKEDQGTKLSQEIHAAVEGYDDAVAIGTPPTHDYE